MTAIPEKSLSIAEEIGKGRFKRVHKGMLHRKEVVIMRYAQDEGVTSELELLALLSRLGPNPYVPEVHGTCRRRDATLLVQEYARWGSLRSVISEYENSAEFRSAHKLHASAQMAGAMAFLERQRIVHADLSCRNVLVFCLLPDPAATKVKVTDFGLSLLLPEGCRSECRKQPRAVRWCAPETILESRLGHEADVWSLGASLWELFAAGKNPWAHVEKRADVAERLQTMAKECAGDVAQNFPCPEDCPPCAHEALLTCLRVLPADRVTFQALSNVFAELAALDSMDAGKLNGESEKAEAEEEGLAQGDSAATAAIEEKAEPRKRSDEVVGCHSKVALAGESSATPCVSTQASTRSVSQATSRSATPPQPRATITTFDDVLSTVDQNDTCPLKTVIAVIRSPNAFKILGQAVVEAMQREVEAALATADIVSTTFPQRTLLDDSGLPQNVPVELSVVPPVARTPPLTPPAFLRSNSAVESRTAKPCQEWPPLREQLFAPGPRVRPPLLGSVGGGISGQWILNVDTRDGLQRTDFQREADARAAFEACGGNVPRILRDPSGAEAVAHLWRASYTTSVTPPVPW